MLTDQQHNNGERARARERGKGAGTRVQTEHTFSFAYFSFCCPILLSSSSSRGGDCPCTHTHTHTPIAPQERKQTVSEEIQDRKHAGGGEGGRSKEKGKRKTLVLEQRVRVIHPLLLVCGCATERRDAERNKEWWWSAQSTAPFTDESHVPCDSFQRSVCSSRSPFPIFSTYRSYSMRNVHLPLCSRPSPTPTPLPNVFLVSSGTTPLIPFCFSALVECSPATLDGAP